MKGKHLFILLSLLAIFLTAAVAFAADETAPSDEYEVPEPEYGVDYEIGEVVGYSKIKLNLYASSEYDGYKILAYDSDDELIDTLFVTADEDNTVLITKLYKSSYYFYYIIKVFGFKDVNGTTYYSNCSTGVKIPSSLVDLPILYDQTVTQSGPDSVLVGHYSSKVEVYYSDSFAGNYILGCSGDGQCVISGLDANKVYYFRHRNLNKELNVYGLLSGPQPFILKEKIEETAPVIGNKKIRVFFDDDEGLTGHQIKAYDVSTGKLAKTVNVKRSKNPTYADITGLKNGTEYRFDICSYTVVGKKINYGEISSVTATPQLKPVDGDTAANYDETAHWIWDTWWGSVSSTSGKLFVRLPIDTWTAGHYVELRRADNGVLVTSAYVASPAYRYSISGSKIEYDVPYFVRIWRYNEKSPKGIGNTYLEDYTVLLSAPTNLSAESSDGSIKISWNYTGIGDHVDIRYSMDDSKASFGWQYGCSSENSNGTNSCTIKGLQNGKPYYIFAHSEYDINGMEIVGDYSKVVAAMPLPVMNSATVTPGSKSLTVQYDKVDGVDGHIIQLYRMSGTKAKLVKTVTSTDKNDQVTVSFKGLSNNTTYRVCISAYKKYEKKVYRSAVATYDDIIPSANAAAGKDLIGVSDIGESFNGFVDPLGELDSQTDTEF